jgi:hypothetical protein
MNEIELYIRNLPDTMEDLSRFLFIGREKYNAVRAELRVIEKLKLMHEVRSQKKEEAAMLAETILDIEVRLGEMFKKIPKASNQYKSAADNDVDSKTKKEVLENLGFSQKQAERLETLADNTDLVEFVKDEARENGEFPTRTRILKLAADNNPTNEDAAEIKEYDNFMDLRVKVFKELAKIIKLIADFEITPQRMAALLDNFDAVLKTDNQIRYINESIDKLNKIKSELWKGGKYEKRE